MRTTRFMCAFGLSLALGALLSAANAQGKGYGKENKPDKSQGRTAGNQDKGKQDKQDNQQKVKQNDGKQSSVAKLSRGNAKRDDDDRGRDQAGKAKETREIGGTVEPSTFRAFALSDKKGQRLAGRAISRANKRGVSDDAFFITPMGGRVHVLNKSGVLLLDLDDDRDIGNWKVVTAPFQDKKGAPSFCRSGEGHPVFGRQWCIDKGFGLGEDNDVRWARVIALDNVVIRRNPELVDLTRDVLVGVLGDVVFNRLAAQAITLGLVEPLSGRWLGEPAGPRVLLVSSGGRPVAEIVDVDRDDRAEVLLVAVRP